MTKVALISIHSLPNYGSVLQTYASQAILENAGIECRIIDYLFPNEWHYSHGISRTSALKKFVLSLAVPVMKLVGYRSQHVLQHNLKVFKKKHFKFTESFNSLAALEKGDWSKYDAVIAGSDQIWSPRFVNGDKAFLLSFVPDHIRKISLSSSFGVTGIPVDMRKHYSRFISRFDAIGVRESSALDIVRTTLGLKIPSTQMLDPTLLLSSSDWNKIAEKKRHDENPYILFYGLFYAFEPRPYIFEILKYFKEKLGYQVISLAGSSDSSGYDVPETHYMENVSPERFISLFRDATMVITTSFHGTAFALNFGKPLISVVPDEGDDRQSTLLSALGAESSIVKIGTPAEEINPFYDFIEAGKRLNKLRKENLTTIYQDIMNK